MEPVEITAGRLHLRPFTASDESDVYAACQDAEIQRWTRVPSPYTREHALEFLAQAEAEVATGEGVSLAMVSAGGGELVGSIALHLDSWEYRRGRIGYLVFAAARGRGLAPRAVRLLSRWAFDRAGLARVGILTAVGNRASQRVAEKAGYTREGVLRAYMDEDMVSWSLLPGEL